MAEEGRRDYLAAKRKAAERLRIAPKYLPTNREVMSALIEHQQLFEAPQQSERLTRLRGGALAAMDALAEFQIRAVGAATGEIATAHALIELHVFVDPPEAFAFRLNDIALAYKESERHLRWGGGRTRAVPSFLFVLDQQPIETLVFAANDLREAPTDPANGRPMRRLTRAALEKLLPASQRRGSVTIP